MLRQQKIKGSYALSLSDFIAPKDSKIKDYIGAFAVTAGINAEDLSKKYEDYNLNHSFLLYRP